MRYLIFILAFASAWGQVEDYGRTANAAAIYDLTAAAITRSIKSGASDPATCTSGKDLFINTSSTPVIKLCTATNTWTALGSSSMVYPGAGIAVSNGSGWGTSLTVGTGANNLVQLNGSSQLPAVSAALLTNFPTLNQNTTGTAAGLTAQYIDWNASSGGTSIANKPTLTNGTVTVVSSGNLTSTALVTGGGTQTLQTPAATATMDSSGNISTPGSISTGAGGSTAGVIEFGQGTAPSAGTTSVKLYAPASVTSYVMNLPGAAATGYLYGTNSAGVVTQSFRTIQAGDVPALGDRSETLTNKTLDAEGTGNSITIPIKIWLPAVGCAGTTGTLMWDTLASNAPTATCSAGSTETTMMRGTADFPDSDGAYSLQQPILLPDDWTGAIDVKFLYRTTATTGNTIWQAATACRADAEVDDVAFNTASVTSADAAKGTTLQLNTASIAGVTATGCAAGELLHLKVIRDRTHASDTITGVVSLVGVEVTLRRAM